MLYPPVGTVSVLLGGGGRERGVDDDWMADEETER